MKKKKKLAKGQQENTRRGKRGNRPLYRSRNRTEMGDLESQEEDAPKCILWFKPMRWLGQIRSHRRDESWSSGL